MTAIVLILLSAIVHAIVNVLTKRADDKYAMQLLMGGFPCSLFFPRPFSFRFPKET
jgi:drug/metabolite transporter (DMT)-like permease